MSRRTSLLVGPSAVAFLAFAVDATAACTPSVTANLSNGVLTITSTVSVVCGSGGFSSLKIDGVERGSGHTCWNVDGSTPCVWTWTQSGYCWADSHTVEVTANCNRVQNNQDGTQSCVSDGSGTATTTFSGNSTPTVSVTYADAGNAYGNFLVSYDFPGTAGPWDRYLALFLNGALIADTPINRPASQSDVWPVNYSIECLPPGDLEVRAVAIACNRGNDPAFVDEAFTTIQVNSKPEVSVEVPQGTNVANITYSFPNTRNTHSRDLDIYVNDVLREARTSLEAQAATIPYELPACWQTLRVVARACDKSGDPAFTDEADTEADHLKPAVDLSILRLGDLVSVTGSYDLKTTSGGSFRIDLAKWVDAAGGTHDGYPLYVPDPPVPSQGTFAFTFIPPSNSRQVVVRATAVGVCQTTTRDVSFENTCSTRDPVFLQDGNVRVTDADPLPPIAGHTLVRTYDSQEGVQSLFGRGWTTLFERRMVVDSDGTNPVLSIVTATNEVVTFRGAAGSFRQTWPSARTSSDTLRYDAVAGTYTHRPAGSSGAAVFRATDGHLLALRDTVTGREAQIAYDAQGVPQSLTDSWTGTSWLLTIDTPARRVSSIAVGGRPDLTWTYQYNADGTLLSVLAPVSATWRTYEYANGLLTASYDALGHLIEAHTYDAEGYGISSIGPNDEIEAIEYNLAGSVPGERVTRVTYKTGAAANYVLRGSGGNFRPVRITGGCATCGTDDATYVHDSEGRVLRMQNADGYVSVRMYTASGLSSLQTSLRPQGCDPQTDLGRCRLSPDELATAVLETTTASFVTTYQRGDPLWPDRATAIAMPSVVTPTAVQREEYVHHPGTGAILRTVVRGRTGDPAVEKSRVTVRTYYGDVPTCDPSPCPPNDPYAPAFTPGGPFSSGWLALAQPSLVKSIDGPRGDVQDVTSFVYYPIDGSVPALLRGHLAAIKNAAGHITRYEDYDVFGNATRVVDANGVVNETGVDLLGRRLTSTVKAVTGCDTAADPLCATDLVSSSAYSPAAGPLQTMQQPGGGVAVYSYDSRGRVATVSRGPSSADLRERVETTYDPLTGKASVERTLAMEGGNWGEKRRESSAYDSDGRFQTLTHADGAAVHYTYDSAGRIATMRDENHSAPNTRYFYDPAGRLREVTQTLAGAPGGAIATRYAYDLHGNLVEVTDPNGNVTEYTYDDFGQMMRQESPVTGATSYAYDDAGNLLTTTDARSATTLRTYDALGRVRTSTSSRTGSPTEVVQWDYDAAAAGRFGIGRLTQMTDPAGVTSYSYQRLGLVRREQRTFTGVAEAYVTRFEYDRNGNRSRLIYPSGLAVTYGHDFAGRPVSAVSGATTFISSATYLPFGPVKNLVYGNGTSQTLAYDTRYRMSQNTLTSTVGALAQYDYGYDAAGNITALHDALDNGYNRDFGYDELNRLVTANTGLNLWRTGSYTYDGMGNMLSLRLGEVVEPPDGMLRPGGPRSDVSTRPLGRVTTFAYDANKPKLSIVTTNDLERPVTYDAAGNELTPAVERTYSARNLMAAVSEDLEGVPHTIQYAYDGRGVLAKRSEPPRAGGNSSRYVIFSPELRLLSVTENDAPNPWLRGRSVDVLLPAVGMDIVWFGDRPVAQSSPLGGTPRYTHADHLGTPILQTDSTAQVVWRVEHEPFGNVYDTRAGNRTDQPLRFPGQVVSMTNSLVVRSLPAR